MESPAEAAAPGARTFSQVVFTDIPQSYPLSTNVTCRYTLTAAFEPNPRDWVGIFKVGWSTTKDYHTFVWVEPCQDEAGQQPVTREAAFKDYYLPKDEMEFYQFCYVDSGGQVRGASTPFCFRNPEHSMESNPDDDLLVVTTQEQVEQSVREKAGLQKELDQIMEENESLKSALEDGRREAASLKRQNDEREEEKSRLVAEMLQVKEENEKLKSGLEQQLQETGRLKEALTQATKQTEIHERHAAEQKKASSDAVSRQNEANMQEKYDRAVMKINQLKEERQELRGRVDAQSEEIAVLKFKIREEERELNNMKDNIQLLQVDLHSSEKEKGRVSAELQKSLSLTCNMDEVKKENKELCRRLSQLEALHNCRDEEGLRVQCQTLTCQLQDAQAKLVEARDESKVSQRRVEYLDGELVQIRTQLEKLSSSLQQGQKMNGKLELQLRETREAISDKDAVIEEKERLIKLLSGEKEELARESQSLIRDLEELRSVYADLQAAAEAARMRPDTASPAGGASPTRDWQEATEPSENLYENIGDVPVEEEEALECCHCRERFPFITWLELEQHKQSHRICPFCSMVCDSMEQSAFEDHVYAHEL